MYVDGRWQAIHLPGIDLPPLEGPSDNVYIRTLTPRDDFALNLRSDFQPIFKLHGSSNWRAKDSDLMILGANKRGAISQFGILRSYLDQFEKLLNDDDARLMVIGYGFRDEHINAVLQNASRRTLMKMFVIDPLGLDVMNPNLGRSGIPGPTELYDTIVWRSLGASRRDFRATLERDHVELKKVMSFFDWTGRSAVMA